MIGTKLRFLKGDIIFGRRRAYQRKLAVAEMDGICSAHAMVVRAKPALALPEFLPFLMMSDKFMNRAVEISVGSLSPTINWTTLKLEEFTLPPLDLQRRIAQILIAVDKSISLQLQCHEAAYELMQSERADIFTGRIGHSGIQQFKVTSKADGCNLATVDDLSTVVRGASPRPKGDPRYYGGKIPRVMVADITRDKKYITPCIDFLTEEGSKLSRPVPKGTLILVCSGTPQQVGLPGILTKDACIHDGIIALTEIDERCRAEWLFHLFRFFQSFMDSAATHGGTFVNLTTDIVKGIQIGLPSIQLQDEQLARLAAVEEVTERLDTHVRSLKSVFQTLVDTLL